MHFDSLLSQNMMNNDVFNVPMDMASQNPIVTDGFFSLTTSVSLAQSNSHDLNNPIQMMAGFPALSMLQGEPINDLHTGFNLENRARISISNAVVPRNTQLGGNTIRDPSIGSSCPISYTEVPDRYMAGMPISATSLATLLAARFGAHENLNDIATSAPLAHPVEALKTIVSNEYSDTLQTSFGTTPNCGYDGMLSDMSSKWEFDKFLAPPEISGAVSERIGLRPSQLMGNMDLNRWISSENTSVSSDSPSSSSRFSNELSLSLATSQPSVICGTTIPDQCSEISCSGISGHSFHETRLGSQQTKNLSLSVGSYKPVQLSHLLTGSRYLGVMQELLAEIASYSLESMDQMSYPTSGIGAGVNISSYSSHTAGRSYTVMGSDDFPDGDDRFEVEMDPMLRGREVESKRKNLLALLQVVDDQYSQCLAEIHTVVSAFHAVTELDPQIHAHSALQMISFLYKNLREKISNHILAMGAHFNRGGTREEDRSFETSFIQKQWALQQLRRKDHQLWRPQRGLPERSVSVLRAWMFQNFLHPYPKDAEKHLLAVKSGLTRSQVSNWFINARVRLWKPMIEEMYSEMNRRKSRRNDEENGSNRRNHISIDNRSFRMN